MSYIHRFYSLQFGHTWKQWWKIRNTRKRKYVTNLSPRKAYELSLSRLLSSSVSHYYTTGSWKGFFLLYLMSLWPLCLCNMTLELEREENNGSIWNYKFGLALVTLCSVDGTLGGLSVFVSNLSWVTNGDYLILNNIMKITRIIYLLCSAVVMIKWHK